jgi:cellulose biosynthesis protein BcsQ
MTEESRATKIALFNHKGGVSKTTTTFNLGWKLAEKGHVVVLVDADPQCNLTGMVSGYTGMTDLERFYTGDSEGSTIYAGLAPAFEAQPRSIEAQPLIQVQGRPGLHLMAGDIRLAEYENTLGIAQELSGSIQALKNLPGSLNFLIDRTAESVGADIVMVDMSPGLGPVNQNLVSTSDYVIIPAAPDFFSVMAIDSLSRVLPRWNQWAVQAASLPVLQGAAYPFPVPRTKVLGTIIQKYRPRTGQPAASFQRWIDEINGIVEKRLIPELLKNSLLLERDSYESAGVDYEDLCLAQIPEFNSLIAKSQDTLTPVFALTEAQLGARGSVRENWVASRDSFNTQFDDLTDRILTLIGEN